MTTLFGSTDCSGAPLGPQTGPGRPLANDLRRTAAGVTIAFGPRLDDLTPVGIDFDRHHPFLPAIRSKAERPDGALSTTFPGLRVCGALQLRIGGRLAHKSWWE